MARKKIPTKKVKPKVKKLTRYEEQIAIIKLKRDFEAYRHGNKIAEIKAEEEKERLFCERRKEVMRIQMGMDKKKWLSKWQKRQQYGN